MAHRYKNYPVAVMVAIDQLGNALTGGNSDSTVSARVGYFSVNAIKRQALWKILEVIIDYAFYPVDGQNNKHPSTRLLIGKHPWRQTRAVLISGCSVGKIFRSMNASAMTWAGIWICP